MLSSLFGKLVLEASARARSESWICEHRALVACAPSTVCAPSEAPHTSTNLCLACSAAKKKECTYTSVPRALITTSTALTCHVAWLRGFRNKLSLNYPLTVHENGLFLHCRVSGCELKEQLNQRRSRRVLRRGEGMIKGAFKNGEGVRHDVPLF